MFPALDMELEIVRTVLHNEYNDIYVCTDLKENTGVFYTMVSIRDTWCRKLMTGKLNTEGLFFSNNDFIGSFIYGSCLNLVFRYYHENRLDSLGAVYLVEFSDCKKAAIDLVASYAQCNADSEIGTLLLQERNINIRKNGEIYFNYFIDFSLLQKKKDDIELIAEKAFEILELNYREKYDSPENYPNDLKLFYRKMINTGFGTVGNLIASIRAISDKPGETKGLLPWLKKSFQNVKYFLFHNSMATFLTILVIVTLIYAANQIYSRWIYKKAYQENVSYYGIETIGDVYLGNEE